ncbi:MAG: tRNA (adenosine(37)-N6)-dimethylallyltransferase MiaA [Cytophagaceae bacterium]|nr:tRNA (adenosine(37)-N6)-dimethylallyltransferase MiaA [Cytophagaceae bacterium]
MTNTPASKYDSIVILGPTASGKTTLAAHLAATIGGEIISADSRQIYRKMDIGTGKDLDDYVVNGEKIPFHLIDIREPGYKYNVYEYQTDFFNVFADIKGREKFSIVCGGTGLYIEAVLRRFKMIHVPSNPELRDSLNDKDLNELETILSRFRNLHNSTDTDTKKRAIRAIEIETYYSTHPEIEVELPKLNPLITGIESNRETRREKITKRLHERLKSGMIEEVDSLLKVGLTSDDLIYYGLEYKYVTMFLIGQLHYNEMVEQLNIAIHQFAKRQMTWFRRMERNGFRINWLDANLPVDEKVNKVLKMMAEC